MYAKLKDFKGNIDRTQNIEWTPPSNIVIESRSSPSGSNDPEMILEYRVLNGITPARRGVTHHFWAVPRNFAPEPEVTEAFHEGSVRAFSEDVEVLEDLVLAAINDAKAKADERIREEMQKLTGGLALPPGMQLPF